MCDDLSSSTPPHVALSQFLCSFHRSSSDQPTAFMLYRQHYQSAVVADHPGLANPEISKIIGLQWREESQEVRDNWDKLAEVRLLSLHTDVRLDRPYRKT